MNTQRGANASTRDSSSTYEVKTHDTISLTADQQQLPRLLTAEEVAGALRCSVRKIYDLVERGEIGLTYKLFEQSRKGWRWSPTDVLMYLQECQVRAQEGTEREIDTLKAQHRSVPTIVPAFDPEKLRRKTG